MSSEFRRAVGISGWLVATTVVIVYLVAKYDVTVRERRLSRTLPVVGADAGAAYGSLAAAMQAASGAELLALDGRLKAAEREFPWDYRFSYERARLAVYGRAEHHEAFYYLKRAAEKAIATERAAAMLARLEEDGGPKGRLRKLAVGHSEWALLHEALEHSESHRLWQERGSRHSDPTNTRRAAGHRKRSDSASAPTRRAKRALSARMRASSLLESGEPCGALVVLQQVRPDPEVVEISRYARELCMRGPG